MKRIFAVLLWVFVVANVVAQQYAVVDGLRYSIAGNTASVVQREEEGNYAGNIIIPSKITIEAVDYNVTSIGYSAFKNCTDLTTITIPESVTSIASYAFYNCSGITYLEIPRNVSEIGDYAFRGCSNLRYAVVPKGVNVINVGVFQECTNLNQVVLPNGITRIKDWAFHQSGITSITIPEGITSLGNSTFANCNKLQTITLPESLVSMDEYAVYGCKNLSKVVCSAKTPPSYTGEPFYYYSASLYVPCESIAKYENDTKWGNFANIECKQIAHLFSVSDNKRVAFSPGNLQYNAMFGSHECADGTTKQGTWRFAEHQYDMIGEDNQNISETYDGWIDLFCWGTSGWNSGAKAFEPYNTSTTVTDYGPSGSFSLTGEYANADWGVYNSISNGGNKAGLWRTLTKDEYNYLINLRKNASTKYGYATINNVAGIVFLPDLWILPNKITFESGCTNGFSTNTYTESDWRKMEENGAIFLPASGSRQGSSITLIKNGGSSLRYWSSSVKDASNAFFLTKADTDNGGEIPNIGSWYRRSGYSVRLVRDYPFDLFPNIRINEGEIIPSINLLDYFIISDTENHSFEIISSNNQIVFPVLMKDKLGFIQYGTGTVTIEVSLIDGSNKITKSFTVTINPTQPEIPCNLSLSSEITNVACNGEKTGKIEVSVSNGTEPYYYKWNTGRTSSGIYNIGAGSYSVLVMDDNGCTAEKSFTISEPTAIEISETLTKPNCSESDGKIELSVSGGVEPYSYEWSMPDGTKQTTKDIENLSLNIYDVTITDGNSCKMSKTILLPENDAPIIVAKSISPSKCNEATGSVEVNVSGGTSPYRYEWSDSSIVSNNLKRPKLHSGSYKLRVIDSKNCSSVLSVRVPIAMFRLPEIALVSYGDTARHNLVVWQKEQTNDIDEYCIYRETAQSGEYEKIGSSSYNDVSIYIDETADFNASSCRYRISAANSCVESPLSHEYKTIQLHWQKNDNGSVQLWWDPYEGFEFVKYDLYRLTHEGLVKFKELPANKFKYTVDMVESGTIGYFVAVELIDTIDVNQYLKAEGGPFSIAFSNIAEIENRDVVDEFSKNQSLVFSKNKTIFISNAGENNIFVCDMMGKIIAQRQKVDSAEIPVKTAGVYVVIVGDRVFKLRIMN